MLITLQDWFMLPVAVLLATIAMAAGVGVLFILVAAPTPGEVIL